MAADDVAAAVGRVAAGAPVDGVVEVAGPDQFRLDEFIRRGLSVLGDDDAARKALYAAVRDFGLADDGGPAQGAPEARVGMHRARPFDPSRIPTSSEPSKEDDAEARALRETAQQGHHQLLAHLHVGLQRDGWTDPEEIPAAIDLTRTQPARRARHL
ncbi:MAG TPA: hypothetical protein VGO71_21120 [Baekduia sp.]|nr:hypothetical protein [Baekduia sp.]